MLFCLFTGPESDHGAENQKTCAGFLFHMICYTRYLSSGYDRNYFITSARFLCRLIKNPLFPLPQAGAGHLERVRQNCYAKPERNIIMKTIAIIDDDLYIGDMLSEVLSKEGFGVLRAYSGTEALYLLKEKRPDLVLLDLMLPGMSGEEVLSYIKGIPVIVLSARAEVQDKIDLLLGGAADYMTKPFDTGELLARIAVQLRRTDSPSGAEPLTAGDLSIDPLSRSLSVCGKEVRLTRTEYAIIKLLMENPGRVIARSVLLDRIGADTPDCTERSLKQHISNLRKKLQEAGDTDYIETVWGIGFKLRTVKILTKS